MKWRVLILFVCLSLISCVSNEKMVHTDISQNTNEDNKIYFYDYQLQYDPKLEDAYVLSNEDGTYSEINREKIMTLTQIERRKLYSIVINRGIWVDTLTEEEYHILTDDEKENVEYARDIYGYYVWNSQKRSAVFYYFNTDVEEELIKSPSYNYALFTVQNKEQVERELEIELESGNFFVDYDYTERIMRPAKPNQKSIAGKWVTLEKNFREVAVIPENVKIYPVLSNENLDNMKRKNYGLIRIENCYNEGTKKTYSRLKFYDGKYLYDVICPLKDVSDDAVIKEAVKTAIDERSFFKLNESGNYE